MAEEKSPYKEEEKLEKEIEELIIQIIAVALVSSSDLINSDFSYYDLENILDYFKSKSSEIIPTLDSYVHQSANLGLDRAKKDLGLSSLLALNFASGFFYNLSSNIFEDNFSYILQTLREGLYEIEAQKALREWSEKEYLKNLKLLFGLSSSQVRQTISYRESLKNQLKPKLDSDTINKLIQERVDRLLNWRLKLISTRLSVSLVEGSKLAAWKSLEESNQLSLGAYGKQWVSVIDDVTTQTCISTNKEIVGLSDYFSNGVESPPAINPLHPCRSSIRLVKL